jgi:hypothetical protein
MCWYLHHFDDVGIEAGFIALACGVLIELDTLQKLLPFSIAALCVHEFEEHGWPGGFPSLMNRVVFSKILARLVTGGGPSDRYILGRSGRAGPKDLTVSISVRHPPLPRS